MAGQETLWEETFKLRLKKDTNHVKRQTEVVCSGRGSNMDRSPKGEKTLMHLRKLRKAWVS